MKKVMKMKAVVCNKYGSPEALNIKYFDKPSPKPNQILVKVHATTVNRTDQGIRTGSPYLARFIPMGIMGVTGPIVEIQGTEFSGKIEHVGNEVKTFKKGDDIFGRLQNSCNAEYLLCDETKGIAHIPKDFTYEMAVAGCEGAHYAHTIIFQSKMNRNHRVLVNGATGAIGSACVQILKYLGIYCVAIGNTKNVELIKSLGADKVLDYQTQDVTLKIHHESEYDFIIDTVTISSFGKFKSFLKSGGSYLTTDLGPYYCQNPLLIIWTKFFGDKKVKLPVSFDIKTSILFLKKMMDEGKWKPIIDRRYQIDDIVEAARYVELGEKTGSVVININSNEEKVIN